ncbi:hypothetical protein [Nannocystis sp. SCPEA4]|uniref:hypothetical protein n=1 Tax=Nannocystis sp. SCPEA4 TaxID=2996787 RepID=UPI00226FBE94|nr:hypothetical protein [Nannocystis sp. SCPEA4]MCY1059843.1 hypothetical protein [Nannocystis sp. SCPEA4]
MTLRGCSRIFALSSLSLGGCLDPTAGGDDASDTANTAGTTEPAATAGPTTDTAPTTTGTATTPTTTGDSSTSDGTTGEPPGEQPDLFCPDGPQGGCDAQPDAPLEAGAAVLSLVPNCWEKWIDFDMDNRWKPADDMLLDCGCDQKCPGDPGYTAPDMGEGDGELQPLYMAGFGHNRPALGVRDATQGLVGEGDGLWARAIGLRQGESTLAIVAIDTVGYFNNDVQVVRDMLADEGVEVDYLIVHATHNHEGPDTMGLWGVDLFTSGYDPGYRQQVRETIVAAVKGAFADIREVGSMRVGEVDVSTYHDNGMANVLRDSRDPWVADETMSAAHLVDTEGVPIATLINYGCHPETLANDNLLVTSDFVHALRRTVEEGSTWQTAAGKPGLGGPAIYINGAVGGMMTTLGVNVENPDGETHQAATFEKADSVGQMLGEMALDAVELGEEITAPTLRFAAKRFRAPVVNTNFKLFFDLMVLEREVFNSDMPGKEEIETEMGLVELGPIQMLTVPGELLPELQIGGYDGSHINAEGVPLIKPDNVNPPDLDAAPKGPYIEDRMGLQYRWIIGLGNDELGYIIPEYDFELAEVMPWVSEAEGNHYEETNSLGPAMAGLVDQFADLLIAWSKQ